jgi:hypothetical protein
LIPLNRHGPAVLLRKIKRWFESDLDPTRVARVFTEFDEQRGYAAWHEHCKAALKRPLPVRNAPGPLVQQGFSVQQILPPDRAKQLLETAKGGQQVARLKRDSAKLEGYDLSDPALVRHLTESVLSDEIDAHCLEFFQSEYFVYWYTLSRTAPVEGPASVSFMWHCDLGPRAHLKLLVYLNDFSEHGGGTSYLSLADSDAVARTGYTFIRGRRRTESLDELAKLVGQPLTAYDHHPQAGDSVLFQPARVLHRGITPNRGPRYVFTLCLLPSPIPWREAMTRQVQIDLREDPLWHDNAQQLHERFGTQAARSLAT